MEFGASGKLRSLFPQAYDIRIKTFIFLCLFSEIVMSKFFWGPPQMFLKKLENQRIKKMEKSMFEFDSKKLLIF